MEPHRLLNARSSHCGQFVPGWLVRASFRRKSWWLTGDALALELASFHVQFWLPLVLSSTDPTLKDLQFQAEVDHNPPARCRIHIELLCKVAHWDVGVPLNEVNKIMYCTRLQEPTVYSLTLQQTTPMRRYDQHVHLPDLLPSDHCPSTHLEPQHGGGISYFSTWGTLSPFWPGSFWLGTS